MHAAEEDAIRTNNEAEASGSCSQKSQHQLVDGDGNEVSQPKSRGRAYHKGFHRRRCICRDPECLVAWKTFIDAGDPKRCGYYQLSHAKKKNSLSAVGLATTERHVAYSHLFENTTAPPEATGHEYIAYHHFHPDILQDDNKGPSQSNVCISKVSAIVDKQETSRFLAPNYPAPQWKREYKSARAAMIRAARTSPTATARIGAAAPILISSVNIRRGQTGSFGLSVASTSRGVSIIALHPGGSASSEGTLRPNDWIHRVNGADVVGWPFERVVQEMGKTGAQESLVLDVWRDVTKVPSAPSATKKRKRQTPDENEKKTENGTVAQKIGTKTSTATRQAMSPPSPPPQRPLLPTRVSARMHAKKKRAALNAADPSSAGISSTLTEDSPAPDETSGGLSFDTLTKLQSTARKIDSMVPTPRLALFRAFLHVVQIPSFRGRWYPLNGWARVVSSLYSCLLQNDSDKVEVRGEDLTQTLLQKHFMKKFLGITPGDLVWNESGIYLSLAGKKKSLAAKKNWCLFVGDCEEARRAALKDVTAEWDKKWKDVGTTTMLDAAVDLELEVEDGTTLCAAVQEMRRGKEEPENLVWKAHVERWKLDHPVEAAAAKYSRKEQQVKPVDLGGMFPTLSKYSIPLMPDVQSKKERRILLRELMKLDKIDSGQKHIPGGDAKTSRAVDESSGDTRKDPTEFQQFPILTSLTKHVNIHSFMTKEQVERRLLGELLKKGATLDPETQQTLPAMAEFRNGKQTMALCIPKMTVPQKKSIEKLYKRSTKSGTLEDMNGEGSARSPEDESSVDDQELLAEQTFKKNVYGALRKQRFLDQMLHHFADGDYRLGAEWIVRFWLTSKEKRHVAARQGVVRGCKKAGFYIEQLDEHGLPIDEGGNPDLKPHPRCTGTYYIDQMGDLPFYVTIRKNPSGGRIFIVGMPAWIGDILKDGKQRRDKDGQITKSFPLSDAGFKKAMEWRDARIADYEKKTGRDAWAAIAEIAARPNLQQKLDRRKFDKDKVRRKRKRTDSDGDTGDEDENEEVGLMEEEEHEVSGEDD